MILSLVMRFREKIKKWASSLFPISSSKDIVHLYGHIALYGLAQSMVLLFEPVYLWSIGYSLGFIGLYYLIVYGAYLILIPLGAKYAEKNGYEKSIAWSVLAWILYFLSLSLLENNSGLFFVTGILFAIQKSLYWPAFHAFFSRYITPSAEGREVSGFVALDRFSSIFGPLLSAILISTVGFSSVFISAGILAGISVLPLLLTMHPFTVGTYTWCNHWKLVFGKENWPRFRGLMGFMEELILFGFWPIYIAIFVGESGFGFLITVTTLISIGISLLIGKWTDTVHQGTKDSSLSYKEGRVQVLTTGAVAYAGSWLARWFVITPAMAFGADIWSRVTKDMVMVPLQAMTYDQGKEIGSSPIIAVVRYESVLIFAKIIASLLIILITFTIPQNLQWRAIFTIAALASMFYAAYRPR